MALDKDKKGKWMPWLIPSWDIIKAIAQVREKCLDKYPDTTSWRRVDTRDYRDAMMRHMVEYVSNPQSRDRESGLPHLFHIACNCCFLCALEVFCDE